jgi:hypothetical protein
VFEGKGACLSCHRVGEQGSRKAPDLSDIGSIRAAGRLISLDNPITYQVNGRQYIAAMAGLSFFVFALP